jgi:hypothetical protein
VRPGQVSKHLRDAEDMLEKACEAAFDSFYNVTQENSQTGWVFERDEEFKAEWREAIRAAFKAVEDAP